MKVIIDEKYCKGCELCMAVCKPGALCPGARRNATGYIVPEFHDDLCVMCSNCEWVCPEMTITVNKTARNKREEHA